MKIVDISHVLDENTPSFPGDPQPSLPKVKTMERDGYISHFLQAGLHTGTHIDMPMHLTDDQRSAGEFPLGHFIGKGVLLDVREEDPIAMKPQYENTVLDGSIVLLHTGFDSRYFTEAYFTKHPSVSDALAGFLLARRIKLLGMDMPSPDHSPYTLHKALLSNGVCLLENLTNLQSLLEVPEFEVMALPLKISAEASFVRAACRISD